MERETWCADKITQLQNEDLRIPTLTEIKDRIQGSSQDEVAQIAKCLQLPLVFDCLNDSKSEQIDLACEVLSTCLSNLSLGESTNKYGIPLERALSHPSPTVKRMALSEINRCLKNMTLATEVAQHQSLLMAMIVCVGDDDVGVAKVSSDALCAIGRVPSGLKQLLTYQVRQVFSETIAISEIVRFRVYELVVNIAINSEESLHKILNSGLIRSLISELSTNDVLLKLNVLELLSNLAMCDHGLVFLEGEGVIKDVIDQFAVVSQDPLALIVVPGYLKFFGNVAHWKPFEMNSQYSHAFNTMFAILNSEDMAVLGVAYDTLGHIAKTNEGKLVLNKPTERIESTLKILGSRLISLPTDLRIRALNCIENLIRIPIHDHNNEISTITELWFNYLSGDPVSIVVRYAQNPFWEMRMAGLGILHALSEQLWGQSSIKDNPGLTEFLMDRNVETCKETKELKYEIVKNLSISPVMNEDILAQLQNFVREGPFYVQAITEVAVEGF